MDDSIDAPERCVYVPGYQGRYMVTDRGRVLSLVNGDRGGMFWRDAPLELSGTVIAGGYRCVTLTSAKAKRKVKVGALVLEAFVGRRPRGSTVAHENGDPSDDRLCNLSWKSQAENNRDKVRHGTSGKGERNPSAIVSATDVREMRRRAWLGESYASIARDYPISAAALSSAVRGKTWVHTLPEDRLALARALEEVAGGE